MLEKVRDKRTTFAVILFMGFTICIFAPYELYSLNEDELWFMLSDFWFIPLICGIVFWAAAIALVMILKEKRLRIYQGVLFGLAFCAYFQGNFLNLKLRAQAGENIEWGNYTVRMIVDLVIWILVTAVFVILRYRNVRYSEIIVTAVSLFLTVTQFAALVVLLLPHIGRSEVSEHWYIAGYPSDKDVMALSPENNVIVFVLDRYDEEYFVELIAEEPEFKDRLDGFTYYSNMVGEYSATNWAIAFLLSGQYCLQGSSAIWIDNSCMGEVYWDELLDHGYEMSIYSSVGYIPARAAKNSINSVHATHSISDYKMFTTLLYRFVMSKYFPDIVKPAVWMIGSEFNECKEMDGEYGDWRARNLALRDVMNEKAVSADKENPQFKFIHIGGTHAPCDIDENGNRTQGYSDEKICAKGSMNIVLEYMDEMKKLGIYDSSAIIITADHGIIRPEPSTPIFLVKPMGERGIMAESTAPVSHKDLGATVLDLTDMDLDVGKYGTSALDVQEGDERERMCYRHIEYDTGLYGNPLYRLIEYTTDSEDNALENFHQTGVVYDMWGDVMAN